MNLETCLQMLIKVNKYSDSEFLIRSCCCFHKVNKLVEIKNQPRLASNVNIGKQVY